MKKLLKKMLILRLCLQVLAGLALVTSISANVEVKSSSLVESDFVEKLDEKDSIFNFDCPFYFFKTCGKHPYMMKYNKATNTLTSLSFGHLDKQTGEISFVNFKAKLIESLVPIRLIETYFDANIKVDKKFAGCREPLGEAIANTLKFVDFLPDHTFNGIPFVDEYLAKLPSKWVFGNVKEYKAFIEYLKTAFAENDLKPLTNKPVLLIEIADNQINNIDELDLSFVAQYYRIVSVGDNLVKAFYTECQEILFRVQDFAGATKISGQSAGEFVLSKFEKEWGEFKTKEFLGILALLVAGKVLITPVSKKVNGLLDPTRPDIQELMLWAGLGVTGFIIYNIINKHVLTDNQVKAGKKLDAAVRQIDQIVEAQS